MEAYIYNDLYIDINPVLKIPVIIVNFFGCNFRCPFCYKPEFMEFKSESLIEIKEIKKEIERIHTMAQGILFEGGEPTLQRLPLVSLLRFSKSLNLKTIIHTNGTKPYVIKRIINQRLVDIIFLDLKSSFNPKLLERITRCNNFFVNSKDVLKEIRKTFEFLKDTKEIEVYIFTPIVINLTLDLDMLLEIGKLIKDNNLTWVWKLFKKNSYLSNVKNKIFSNYDDLEITDVYDILETVKKKYKGIKIQVI